MKQKMLSFLMALLLTLSLAPAAWAAEAFTDVPSAHWAYADVMACAEAGIVTGMGDGKFHPGDEVTDTQFIAMLTRTFYNDQVEAARETETSSWYAPSMKVARDVKMLEVGGAYTLTVNDKAMNRYDMAFVLYSTLTANDKYANVKERAAARNSIKDVGSIPGDRAIQVYTCYALGILTGMSNGNFEGSASMTRAQACTVIVRMINLINSEAHDRPAQPEQRKLLNGKDATVENVSAVLEEIKLKYPTGTPWGPIGTPNNNTYLAPYATSKQSDFDINNSKIGGGKTSTMTACGGWAHQVSDLIFGISGAPCREVKSASELRPGDIIYHMDKYDRPTHVAIVYQIDIQDDGVIHWRTCDGNSSAKVSWTEYNPTASYAKTYEPGKENASSRTGSYFLAFTRYPD